MLKFLNWLALFTSVGIAGIAAYFSVIGMEEFVILPEYESNLIFLGESLFAGEEEEKANLDPKVSEKSRSAIDFAKD